MLASVASGAALAATNDATTPSQEIREAAHELAQAALLRYVVRDSVEAHHLAAARDLLAEATPQLAPALRERARRLTWDIGRDLGAAAVDAQAPPPDALGFVSVQPPLDRGELGFLAQRGQALARSIAEPASDAPVLAGCGPTLAQGDVD